MSIAASGQQVHSIGLMIGLPLADRADPTASTPRAVTPEWALSLACQSYPPNVNVKFYPVRGKDSGIARNEIARGALQSESKYLLFIDDDVAVPFFTVRKLIYELEQHPEVSVIGGIYTTKTIPSEPLVFRGNGTGSFWEWKQGDVFEVTGIATGCMMIRTEVFKKIEEPWFLNYDHQILSPRGEVINDTGTDDLYFCKKITDAGMKILADGNVICVHWDTEKGVPYCLSETSYPMRKNGNGDKPSD